MMENCNYDRPEMMVLNIVQKGLFGEVLHAEGGYLHDLREIKFEKKDEGLWRRAWSRKLDGNLYPTHGLGPIANCLDINRGDRFDYLVSMSGPSRGLQDWAREHFPADAPERREQFVLGDVNTSLIKTARGRTVWCSTAPTCRGPTVAFTRCKARRACSRVIRTGFTSKDAVNRTNGSIRGGPAGVRSSTVGRGRGQPPAPGTAGWISSRTIA